MQFIGSPLAAVFAPGQQRHVVADRNTACESDEVSEHECVERVGDIAHDAHTRKGFAGAVGSSTSASASRCSSDKSPSRFA